MHLPHKEGGRGLAQLKISLKMSIIEIDTNLSNTNDWMLKLVKNRKINACTLLLAMPKNIEINLSTDNIFENCTSTKKAKQIYAQAKTKKKIMN